LTLEPEALRCRACDRRFPYSDGIADFSEGRSWDDFVAEQKLPAEHHRWLEEEVSGARLRIRDYYLPRLDALAKPGLPGANVLRILDCGCGNGLSVDLLNDAGYDAWGNDLSNLRKWQWRERKNRDRLFAGDGSRLPFADGFFDVVISSGVLEHIGVRESGAPRYSVEALPERDALRRAFLGELVRVLAPEGRIWLDFPNGAFPIDFWHGTQKWGLRLHSRQEGFLPTAPEVRRHLARSAGELRVRALGPAGRLHFQRIRRRWYGRLLSRPVAIFLSILGLPGMGALAASAINPYLVLEITRRPSGPAQERA
jgi:SAM-dependent methyltransferase